MVLELVLLFFLIATLMIGLRLHFDIRKLNIYKSDFDKILQKIEQSLTDLENTTERFRYILNTEKNTLQRLIQKAASIKDEISFIQSDVDNKTTKIEKQKKNQESLKVRSRKNEIVQSAKSLR